MTLIALSILTLIPDILIKPKYFIFLKMIISHIVYYMCNSSLKLVAQLEDF